MNNQGSKLSWRSPRVRLLAALVGVGLAPLILMVLFAYRSAENAIGEGHARRIQDMADTVSGYIDRTLFERYGDAVAFAASPDSRTMNPTRLTEWMQITSELYAPNYKLMVVANPQGRVVAAFAADKSGKPAPGAAALLNRDVSTAAWFRQTIDGKLDRGQSFVEAPYRDPLVGEVFGTANGADIAMSFSAPIRNADGQLIGVWSNRFDWTTVVSQAIANEEEHFHNDGLRSVRFAIFSENGTPLLTPIPGQVLSTLPEHKKSFDRYGGKASGYTDGVGFISLKPAIEAWAIHAGYASFKNPGWRMVLTEDRDEALASAAPLGWGLTLGVLIAGLTMLAGAAFAAQSMERATEVEAITQAVRIERDSLAVQITKLLDEVTAVADGDLTVRADVTADTLGSVADAFNFIISRLSRIVRSVNGASQQVVVSAREVLHTSEQLTAQTDAQTRRIDEATSAVEQMAVVADRVARNASTGFEIASVARRNAGEGADAARQTMAGMHRIRNEVQETSKKIKRLGESSQEIGQIIQLIEEIADQTNLLALNAAIQAAMAGEHGRGFAVVADEVRRLAERATVATKQIGDLVQSIQGDTNEAVLAMENSTREVVEGSRLAESAGVRLEAINNVVVQLSELIGDIVKASAEQTTISLDVKGVMSDISGVTQSANASARQAAESVAELTKLSEDLRGVVATFRVESQVKSAATAPTAVAA